MIIADTGFWVALLNQRDDFHAVAKASAARINERLVTTWPVVTEVCHLLQTRVGQHRSVQFLQAHEDKLFQLFPLQDAELLRMAKLMERYANLPMDFADASLVVLAEQIGHGRILSTDIEEM